MNDMPMPINICFEKEVMDSLDKSLHVLHTPALTSSSNPFDTRPRLITLQPDETYTVPLTVAYHSPICIQPAASE